MAKRIYLLFPLLIALFFAPRGAAREISKETVVYAVKGADTLRLDRYFVEGETGRPCVIFMFGGGFAAGQRDEARYVPYYEFLVGKGFTVAAIDYRLGMRRLLGPDSQGADPKEFPAALHNSVVMAVEDVFDATGFLIANAAEWGIDIGTIVLSGSSAGAIAVLQAEYERCNGLERALVLPAGFGYAGVIAFAGAVFSANGKPRWNSDAAPVQLFHGDADSNVPYDKLTILNKGLYGSRYIAGQYAREGIPYYFHTTVNEGHSIAVTPMESNLEEIAIFLDRYVLQRLPLATDVTVVPLDKPDVNKKFGFKDFIRANTPH